MYVCLYILLSLSVCLALHLHFAPEFRLDTLLAALILFLRMVNMRAFSSLLLLAPGAVSGAAVVNGEHHLSLFSTHRARVRGLAQQPTVLLRILSGVMSCPTKIVRGN